ncbi:MAG: hypothetical protein KDB23_05310, partial [Planctomycetales bacterium]|nr:hypothetical protein [Planctomycetales bacterium]
MLKWFISHSDRKKLAKGLVGYAPDLAHNFVKRPELSAKDRRGVFVPVVVHRPECHLLCSPGTLLPVEWRRGPHSARLPSKLIASADDVRATIAQSATLSERERVELRDAEWGLHWARPEWAEFDFTDLNLSTESAWAPLAVGLIACLRNGELSEHLFVTGYWDTQRPIAIWDVTAEGFTTKLLTALEFGLTKFVVPPGRLEQAKQVFNKYQQSEIELLVLLQGSDTDNCDLAKAVMPAVNLGGVEPKWEEGCETDEAWVASAQNWYLHSSRPKSTDFYGRELLRPIARLLRGQIDNVTCLQGWRPDHLVTIASTAEELIPLAISVFDPKRCTLFATRDVEIKKSVDAAKGWLEDRDRALRLRLRTIDIVRLENDISALSTMTQRVRHLERLNVDGCSGILLDLTPGRRVMQMAVLEGARQGDRIACWWHNTDPITRRSVPFTEQPLVWEVKSDRLL